jgi:hypothetical protein
MKPRASSLPDPSSQTRSKHNSSCRTARPCQAVTQLPLDGELSIAQSGEVLPPAGPPADDSGRFWMVPSPLKDP